MEQTDLQILSFSNIMLHCKAPQSFDYHSCHFPANKRLTCFRWFLRIVPSGSGRFGRSSAEPDGGVILFESRSTSQMSSGSLKQTACMTKFDFKAIFWLFKFLRYGNAWHKFVPIKMHSIKFLQMAPCVFLQEHSNGSQVPSAAQFFSYHILCTEINKIHFFIKERHGRA